jgi:hypothetical protein
MSSQLPSELIWTPQLTSCTWRVETINAASRGRTQGKVEGEEEGMSVICLLEMSNDNKKHDTNNKGKPDIARFELNREEMGNLLRTLEDVDAKLQSLAEA